ncbi:hypothetical protein [Streptomyces sp. NPDC056844]|uniref:hypothetical protein n=1 Tax=unclassified Streptomyces TaxID=2593676 RepID=UPI0036B788DD
MARDFETLKTRVHDVSYTPGTDALRRVGPLLLQAQDLTATAMVRLTALDNSAYTHVAGSRAGLDLLSSVVSSSSLAGADLAHVLLANPYEGEQFAGYPADDEAVRASRHAEAIPKMSGHLNDAVHQLDLCATGCHYLAHGIAEDLDSAQNHKTAAVRQTAEAALSADTGTSLFQGQKITVPGEGQRSLAEPRPHAALSTAASTAPQAAPARGVRR